MTAAEPNDDTVPRVRPDSHLTLHYRISLARSGDDVISTFSDRPATLTLEIGRASCRERV